QRTRHNQHRSGDAVSGKSNSLEEMDHLIFLFHMVQPAIAITASEEDVLLSIQNRHVASSMGRTCTATSGAGNICPSFFFSTKTATHLGISSQLDSIHSSGGMNFSS
ncbi:hypothetical protein P7K49_035382, partial [Saguinus oedipus]